MKACIAAIFAMVVVLFGAAEAQACECGERRAVSEEIRASEHMVILILRSVENERAVLTVAMTYKGDLKPDEELVFEQGAGADCKWRFDSKDINGLFLFYLDKRPEKGLWQASTCSRSALVKDAVEDINLMQEKKKSTGPKLRWVDPWRPTPDPRVGL